MPKLTEDERAELAAVGMKLHKLQKVAEAMPPGIFFTPTGLDRMREVRGRLQRFRMQDNDNIAPTLDVFLDWWRDQDEIIFAMIHNRKIEQAAQRKWLEYKGFDADEPIEGFGTPLTKARARFWDFREALTLVHEDWWSLFHEVGDVYEKVRSRRS